MRRERQPGHKIGQGPSAVDRGKFLITAAFQPGAAFKEVAATKIAGTPPGISGTRGIERQKWQAQAPRVLRGMCGLMAQELRTGINKSPVSTVKDHVPHRKGTRHGQFGLVMRAQQQSLRPPLHWRAGQRGQQQAGSRGQVHCIGNCPKPPLSVHGRKRSKVCPGWASGRRTAGKTPAGESRP